MAKIISCPNCGQKNRIEENSVSSQAICGKCWTRLGLTKETAQAPPPPPEEPFISAKPKSSSSGKSGSNLGWWLLLGVGGLIWWIAAQDSGKKTRSNAPATSYSKPAPSYPEITMPNNGAIQIYTNGERVAPFTIQTSKGTNYLVKLVSANSQQPVMTIFIKGGNTVSTEVPLGEYKVKYASGDKWYGYNHLFGADTEYSRAESLFTFENTGYQISGYTITLYRVSNGNLRTSKINPSQF